MFRCRWQTCAFCGPPRRIPEIYASSSTSDKYFISELRKYLLVLCDSWDYGFSNYCTTYSIGPATGQLQADYKNARIPKVCRAGNHLDAIDNCVQWNAIKCFNHQNMPSLKICFPRMPVKMLRFSTTFAALLIKESFYLINHFRIGLCDTNLNIFFSLRAFLKKYCIFGSLGTISSKSIALFHMFSTSST